MTEEIKYIETHIGEYLEEEFLTPLGISANALSIAIRVPASRIHEILKGRRGVTLDTDLRLCKFFGMSEGFFICVKENLERPDVKRNIAQDLASIIPYKEINNINHA